MASSPTTTDVLIIGGGPVGLGLAVELGLRGVRCLLIEQAGRTGRQPRAKTTNIRSMEHMRRWGLAEAIRARAPLAAEHPRTIQFATRVFGWPLAKIENALFMSPPRDDRYAEPSQWIPQYAVEDILRTRAAGLSSVTLCFGTTLQAIVQSDVHVAATVVDKASGAAETITARYLVGADGARSATRDLIGARMTGDHGITPFLGLVVRAPGLNAALPLGAALMYFVINPDGAAMMGPMDHGDLWFWMQPTAPGVTLDRAEAAAKFRQSLGRDMPFDIVEMDPWQAHRLIADKYTDRRVFLAGDACHLHPPFGGYGMNMGLGDAVDLGWKLAATLQGWGGPRLLESYEAERRPVHQRTIDEAIENLSFFRSHVDGGHLEDASEAGVTARAALGPAVVAAKSREFRALGVVLGQTYAGSPIVVADGSVSQPFEPMDYAPTAAPGARAPHTWLDAATSLYDRFGEGFTLLVTDAAGDPADAHGPDGSTDTTAMVDAARTLSVPLKIVAPGHAGLSALYGARFALIRPDQHVAWRGDGIDAVYAARILATATGRA